MNKTKSTHPSLCLESVSAVTTLSGPIMANQSKTNSQPRQIHPFFSEATSSGTLSAATSGPSSGTPHTEHPVSIDLTATASPMTPLTGFLSAESLSTLHGEFASIPDLMIGTTPILEERILGLENDNDTEDDDSYDSSSEDNISGNTTSTENPSDSSLSHWMQATLTWTKLL
jgi:hypothetical protein